MDELEPLLYFSAVDDLDELETVEVLFVRVLPVRDVTGLLLKLALQLVLLKVLEHDLLDQVVVMVVLVIALALFHDSFGGVLLVPFDDQELVSET